MKYFLKYSYYILIGVAFACIISALTGAMRWELILIIIVNVYLIRLFDDVFDYYVDKKVKKKSRRLELKQLIWSAGILSVVYIILNVVYYKVWGLFSILILLYMGVQNKHELLKVFFVSVTSMYYIGAYRELGSVPIIVYLCLMVVLSAWFYIYRKQKRMKKEKK